MLASGKSNEEVLSILNERFRDNGRTPMKWNDGANGSFSDGKQWLEVNQDTEKNNMCEQINRSSSIYGFCKVRIQSRMQYHVISDGSFEANGSVPENVFAFRRYDKNNELLCMQTL